MLSYVFVRLSASITYWSVEASNMLWKWTLFHLYWVSVIVIQNNVRYRHAEIERYAKARLETNASNNVGLSVA